MIPEMEFQVNNLNTNSLQNSQSLAIAYSKEMGEVDAVLHFIDNEFSRSTYFEKHVFNITQQTKIAVRYPTERRHKSTPVIIVPIPSSDVNYMDRILFLKLDNMDEIFRISIAKNTGKVEFTDVNLIKKLAKGISVDLQNLKQEKSRNPSYWAKDRFYKKIEWARTNLVNIVEISRTKEFDLIKIRFKYEEKMAKL